MWKQYWPVYERLEREFRELTFSISLDDANLEVFSMYLAELVLRIGQECENASKSLAKELGLSPTSRAIEKLNFPELGKLLCASVPLNTKTVEVRWIYQSLANKLLSPFSSWSSGTTSTNPAWYDAYNGLKHDRNANFRKATYRNALEGLAGLFILNLWLRKTEIETKGEWVELAKERITSYSELFDPSSFLQLGRGSTRRSLRLVI